jgi:hypothetical protein
MINPIQETPKPTPFIPETFLENIGSSSFPVAAPFSSIARAKYDKRFSFIEVLTGLFLCIGNLLRPEHFGYGF